MSDAATRGSDALTEGIRVRVSPSFIPETSDPTIGRFNFAYHVTITNEGREPVTLRRRHWTIVDGDGDRHEVVGDGVVGQQPTLAPGERFEYQSFAPLMTHWGTMEGEFTFERPDHTSCDARVARTSPSGSRSRPRAPSPVASRAGSRSAARSATARSAPPALARTRPDRSRRTAPSRAAPPARARPRTWPGTRCGSWWLPSLLPKLPQPPPFASPPRPAPPGISPDRKEIPIQTTRAQLLRPAGCPLVRVAGIRA